ncbi:MAG: Single-stranded DNA-binding protein [uncultured bacterium]|nr:MAG: Single-stranded DNA-binding protein [uncultured bacterium]OGJ47327.1 MAG: hypothetical protein A2244_00175 [Candidatus Peregrinibacteria bacterium RIFOXYA2_FULL_41_18]OGJ49698.1 MAG: hypothetical protein A2344_02090 [Candidatus Peregrinibacteria bacterium RIFOXYB12_FULL_41_12]OGJ52941.1 MAG: hypothetical protein A2336_04560 [Candidatus Peregrinibacteria bacterium RIFOXYB2_FULL_41_88]OGJ53507.1 MAG: hypothetical protein A2448_02330 [Candidatus Peregrinibacteria bacterium RIFOXYC2_FULL_41
MQYLNKVMLLGHLASDPESKKTENNHTLTKFSVATNKSFTNQNGEKEDRAQFHRIVAWRGLGDICAKHLTKGSLVLVEGELTYRNYEDKEGKSHFITEINASKVIFLKIKKNEIEMTSAEAE